MEGMSAKTVALYLKAAAGERPEPPNLSAPSIVNSDRSELATLIEMMEQGDLEGLKSRGLKTYYSAGQALDRFRHRAILFLEAHRAKAAQAAA
jgi:hypothetical protein